MSNIECWNTLTAEQKEALARMGRERDVKHIEEVNALKLRVSELGAALGAEREAADRLKDETDLQIERLQTVLGEAQAEARRELERTKLVARVLVPVLVDWLDGFSAFTDEALTPFVRQRRKDAVELMRLLTPFAS